MAKPKIPKEYIQEIRATMQKARSTPKGIKVETSDPMRLRQQIYTFRAAAKKKGEDSFPDITVSLDPNRGPYVWLIKKEAENE